MIFEEKSKKHLIAIDNSGIKQQQYVRYGKLSFVRKNYSEALQTNDWYGVPFPFDSAQTMQDPTPVKLKTLFGNKLPDSFCQTFKSYKNPLRYVVCKNSL